MFSRVASRGRTSPLAIHLLACFLGFYLFGCLVVRSQPNRAFESGRAEARRSTRTLGMQRSVVAFLILAVAMAVALYGLGPARLYAALQTNGATAQGVIVATWCGKKAEFKYSFSAEGHSYTGAGASIEECSKYKEGTLVPVVYLVTDPTQNFSGDPGRAYRNYVLVSGIASILLPGFVVLAFHLRKRRHA